MRTRRAWTLNQSGMGGGLTQEAVKNVISAMKYSMALILDAIIVRTAAREWTVKIAMSEWRRHSITARQLAQIIDGREYLQEILPEEEVEAGENGLVVVFGYSDDCIEFRGAIDDEWGAYEGVTLNINSDFEFVKESPNEVNARWNHNNVPWTIESNIPHENFMIYEDNEPFCQGIVFSVDDLK